MKNKIKKNKTMLTAGAVAVLISLSAAVQAIPITGDIGFTGEFTQNGGTLGNLTTATSMTIVSPAIGTTHGSFAGATLVSFASPIAVNPGVGLTTLWQVLVGAVTYTFTATSEVQDYTAANHLHLQGTGTITDGIAADATTGVWQLGFGVSGQSFEWQSTSAVDIAAVPDGGSTVAFLGAGLCGLGLIRRKVMA
ncbi:MAG: VPDSG-CTERM sorting domain-containing protein [Verrucomicrobiota bacterium]